VIKNINILKGEVMENLSYEEWLEQVCQRPLPSNNVEQLETLAMELAEGSILGYWGTDLIDMDKLKEIYSSGYVKSSDYSSLSDKQLNLITQRRFNISERHIISSLISYNLAELNLKKIRIEELSKSQGLIGIMEINIAQLSKSAFDLMKQKATDKKAITLFISYKRKESSAFALLLLNLLKQSGFNPFLDLAIKPGDNWHSSLEDDIQNRDYFIALIGPTTLESPITIKEIEWAIEYGRKIIPIWHNGFEFKPDDWKSLPDGVSKVLGMTHTIRVTEESALAYHSAILELLNHFGITPSL
jgi:hypothetical protein